MRRPISICCFVIAGVLSLPVLEVHALVALPSLFGDNMVMQRDVTAPVWGAADAGEKVVVTFAGHRIETVADAEGRWRVDLPPTPAGGPHELIVAGKNTVRFTKVMVGEVWICAGQSNMGVRLAEIAGGTNEYSVTNYPDLRLFVMQNLPSEKPRHHRERGGNLFWGVWFVDRLKIDYAALPHFFGQEARRDLNVPVGIINAAVGGTPIETWISAQALAADPAYRPILDRWDKIIAAYPEAQRAFEEKLKAWKAAAEKAKAEKQPLPPRPSEPLGPLHKDRPSALYNGVISPLIPFAFRGVIWYQGEASTRDAQIYRKLFPAMIRDWRRAWGQGDFPFIFVQLPEYHAPQKAPVEAAPWAELREAQALALAETNTGMAVALGLGDATEIHPKQKQAVAHRLWLLARNIAYGQAGVCSGPRYQSMTIEGHRIRLRFDAAGSTLVARDGTLKGFAIAGKGGAFVWAQAKIENDTVVVWSETVPEPKTVRYAWADNPVWSLMNREGLPAAPFRTDAPAAP